MTTATPIIRRRGEGGQDAVGRAGRLHLERHGGRDRRSLPAAQDRMERDKMTSMHVRPQQDEAVYVLDGELLVDVEGEQHAVRRGGLFCAPRDVPHAFMVTCETAQVLSIMVDGSGENFYREAGRPITAAAHASSRPTSRYCGRWLTVPPRSSSWGRRRSRRSVLQRRVPEAARRCRASTWPSRPPRPAPVSACSTHGVDRRRSRPHRGRGTSSWLSCCAAPSTSMPASACSTSRPAAATPRSPRRGAGAGHGRRHLRPRARPRPPARGARGADRRYAGHRCRGAALSGRVVRRGAFDIRRHVARDARRAAGELLRVCRPGGHIALANWTPNGYVGGTLAILGRHAARRYSTASATRCAGGGGPV